MEEKRLEDSSLAQSRVLSKSGNLVSMILEKAKINYEHINESKEKNRELKESAHECKNIIKNYKKNYILNRKKEVKINRFLVPWITACIFA